MSYFVQQSSTGRPLLFLMVSSTDHISPVTGLTPTVSISKAGAAFASPFGAVTEVANGWYKVAGNATDTNTLGPLILHATGTGADVCDVMFHVCAFNPDDAVRLGLTSIPNAASGTAGALLVDGTGTAAISNSSGKVLLQATQTGVTIPTVTSVTNGVTVSTNSDKTGYSLSVTPPTSAQIATAVWQDTTAGDFTVSGSIGKSLYTSGNAPGAASGLALVGSSMVAGTVSDKTGYSLSASQTFNMTGNITGNLSGSVGSLTTNNDKTGYSLSVTPPTSAQIATAVWQDTTAGDFTVASSIGKSLYTTGNAPGAASGLALVGSNMGTVTSVSGAVGSVTGNVGGNVVGSVGSVTAGVTVTTNNDKTGYALSSAGVDAVWAKTLTALTSVPSITSDVLSAVNWVFTLARDKVTQTATTQTVYKDDGTTTLATSTVSDDGTTFTRGKFG